MKLIRGLHNLPIPWSACAMTIGNFDGLHLGHQQLIERCKSLSKQYSVPSVLLTFEPYPQVYFSNDENIPRLMSLRDKFLELSAFGIDYLCVLPFNQHLATLSAEAFVQSILIDQFHVKAVVVGDDFRFGAKRIGDANLLREIGKQSEFEVEELPTYVYNNERVSSSRLRVALQNGNLSLAEKLLGHSYCLSGQVVKGDQRGRDFGYPTANVYVTQKKLAVNGIFAVTVDGVGAESLAGVASVGYRPMYPTKRDVLEVYLFDFDQDIYQQHCTVRFLKKIRDEMYFDSEKMLIDQIEVDVEQARNFLMI